MPSDAGDHRPQVVVPADQGSRAGADAAMPVRQGPECGAVLPDRAWNRSPRMKRHSASKARRRRSGGRGRRGSPSGTARPARERVALAQVGSATTTARRRSHQIARSCSSRNSSLAWATLSIRARVTPARLPCPGASTSSAQGHPEFTGDLCRPEGLGPDGERARETSSTRRGGAAELFERRPDPRDLGAARRAPLGVPDRAAGCRRRTARRRRRTSRSTPGVGLRERVPDDQACDARCRGTGAGRAALLFTQASRSRQTVGREEPAPRGFRRGRAGRRRRARSPGRGGG